MSTVNLQSFFHSQRRSLHPHRDKDLSARGERGRGEGANVTHALQVLATRGV